MMSAELERRLRDAFHDDAASVRLVNPNRPADPDEQPLSLALSRSPARSPWRAVAVAAAVILIVATGVAVTENRDRGTGVTTPGPASLFPDLRSGATRALPPAPVRALSDGRGIWTGTELILWGEPSAPDESPPPEGAAFNPRTGTWRTIARAPIQRASSITWTGSEMIAWGDDRGDGAAYDPEADTWRRLPPAPIAARDGATAVWTGSEVIVLTGPDDPTKAAAYDPATNEWRALADANGFLVSKAVWTGTTVLTILDVTGPPLTGPGRNDVDDGSGVRLGRYDPSTDTWHTDADEHYVTLVGVPDRDGVTRTVLAMPAGVGEPVDVLDASGEPIGTLPAHPLDLDGSTTSATGIWLGEQAVFWIHGADDYLFPRPEAWALHPAIETWRRLPEDVASIVNDGAQPVAVGDVLFLWEGRRGIAYRA